MKTYLLTWNPARWPWGGLADEARLLRRGEETVGRWSCGNTIGVQPGDRLFLLKQGKPPRGIVASGWAVSGVYEAEHWDKARKRAGIAARYVDWKLEVLLDPEVDPLLSVAELTRGPLARVHWRTQISGIHIPADAAVVLEDLWAEHLAGTGQRPRTAGVGEGRDEYNPGAPPSDEDRLLKRITVNPAIFGGKPIVRGHRLAVEHVLGMLAAGDTTEGILKGYPWLEQEDVRACLVYARRLVANEPWEASGSMAPVLAPIEPGARPIEDVLREISSQVPVTEWKQLPADLSDDLDHYIYGTPRR